GAGRPGRGRRGRGAVPCGVGVARRGRAGGVSPLIRCAWIDSGVKPAGAMLSRPVRVWPVFLGVVGRESMLSRPTTPSPTHAGRAGPRKHGTRRSSLRSLTVAARQSCRSQDTLSRPFLRLTHLDDILAEGG